MSQFDPRSAWFAWKTNHPATAENAQEAFVAAYMMGARDAIKASAQVSDLVPKLTQLIYWLESDYEGTGEAIPETTPTPH